MAKRQYKDMTPAEAIDASQQYCDICEAFEIVIRRIKALPDGDSNPLLYVALQHYERAVNDMADFQQHHFKYDPRKS